MNFEFDYSEEKNLILAETRKVSFEDIIGAVKKGKKIADLDHPDKKKYPNQRLLIVEINKYAYVVPYVIDYKRKRLFLKTLYPSRKLTSKYFKKTK